MGSAGVGTGSFNWIYGQDPTNPLMSLTYDGKLGVGATQPTSTLHVVGTSTVTNDAFFGQNVTISGNLVVLGALDLPGTLTVDIVGNLTGNVNAISGISTFNNIGAASSVTSSSSYSSLVETSLVNSTSVGVGTTSLRSAVDFADAGKGVVGGVGAQMIVPRLTTTQRGLLSLEAGGIIFNVTTSKFQGYTGIGWTDLN